MSFKHSLRKHLPAGVMQVVSSNPSHEVVFLSLDRVLQLIPFFLFQGSESTEKFGCHWPLPGWQWGIVVGSTPSHRLNSIV